MRNKRRYQKCLFRRETALLAGFILILSSAWGCAGVKPEAGPVFFPPAPTPPRIQWLTSIRTQEDIGDKVNTLTSFILGGSDFRKGIAKPFGVAAHDGVIYVADSTQGTVLTLDLERKEFDYIHDDRSREGKLRMPIGLFIEPDGTKYVADGGRRQVVVFNPDNSFKRALGDGKDMKPIDVVVSDGRVYVSDIERNRVRVYSTEDGSHLFDFGGPGRDEGKFNKPTYLAVDSQGSVYVTDLLNFRIQKFDPDGKFLSALGEAGDTVGTLARPRGVAVDRDGHIYVLDAAFENAQIFNQEGEPLMFFGGAGVGRGKMYLPVKVYIDYEHVPYFQRYVEDGFEVEYLVFVTNQLGLSPLTVYGFGNLKE